MCAKILHQQTFNIKMKIMKWRAHQIDGLGYERSYSNKNNTDDNYDSCASLF